MGTKESVKSIQSANGKVSVAGFKLSRNTMLALAVLGVLALFVMSRFLPHPPNFSPVGAVVLLAGLWAARKAWWILSVFALLFASDLALGLYDGFQYTYLAYALMAFLGAVYAWMKLKGKVLRFAYFAMFNISASLVFFVVSNFGVWKATGLYSQDMQGLLECFVLAIPFYPMSLISQLIFAAVIQSVISLALVPALEKRLAARVSA